MPFSCTRYMLLQNMRQNINPLTLCCLQSVKRLVGNLLREATRWQTSKNSAKGERTHPIDQNLFMLELQQQGPKSEQKISLSFQTMPFCLIKKNEISNCPSYRGRRWSLALFHIINIIFDGLSLYAQVEAEARLLLTWLELEERLPLSETALSSLQGCCSSFFQLGGAQALKRQLLCRILPWG